VENLVGEGVFKTPVADFPLVRSEAGKLGHYSYGGVVQHTFRN
jgi:hypothetical protein